jgi:hypothetical protein
MDTALTMNFTPIQLERTNCVHMFLGVMYLSKISTIDGTSLRHRILTGTHETTVYKITLTTPKQTRPNNRSWELWSRLIKEFIVDGKQLKHRLGEWTSDHSTSGLWLSYLVNDNVYKYIPRSENINARWEIYSLHGTQLQLQEGIANTKFNPNVVRCKPFYIHNLDNGKQYGERPPQLEYAPQSAPVRTYGPMLRWDSFLLSQPKWIQILLEDVEFYTTDDGEPDFYHLQSEHNKHGHLICVSDGSVINHDMSFGWVLASPPGTRLIGSKGPCNGRGNSLRAEGAGMLSGTLFLSILSNYFDQEFKIVFISDNAELIRRMNAHKHYHDPFPNETLRSEFDITEQIYNTQVASKIKPIYIWVKGHQDDDSQYKDLSLEAQLNIDADELAGIFQQQSGKSRPIVHMLPNCPALLLIQGISITSNYRKQLIRASVEPTYIQHLQYKFGWSDEIVTSIAWKRSSLAIPRINRDVILTKICNDLLPTATTLYKRMY